MLRSILYDLLDQDEAFFYHCFQNEYRVQRRCKLHVDWDYASLKKVLKSLRDYSTTKRLYLIIDAVDESEDYDRRDILNLLFKLCSETAYYIIKVFIASRPVGGLELDRTQIYNFIRLQDETKFDISSFAGSFLDGLRLTHVLSQAKEYIVQNAQGVFLWVKLVGEELVACEEDGYAEEEIFKSLKRLPTELDDFYKLMFERINGNRRNLLDAVKMFRFVLFGRRSFTVDELLHALGIPDNPDTNFTLDNSFQKHIPSERRIISCGGSFLEIKPYHGTGAASGDPRNPQTNKAAGNGTVQVTHQTVREFFLDPDGCVAKSTLSMREGDAHVCISITCIRYLMLCAANTTPAGTLPPHIKFWTSEHFESYAQSLDEKALANYALCYLRHHIDGCQQDANVQGITSQFISELTHNSAVYLLETWVSSNLNKILLYDKREGAAAKDFRNKVLHIAAQKGFSTAAEVLLTVGANVNARDKEGRTPLWSAAAGGHERVVRLLLARNDVQADSKDEYGRTPLSRAAAGGHEEVVKLLLARNDVQADSKDEYGRTPLWRAAAEGHWAVVKLVHSHSSLGYTSVTHLPCPLPVEVDWKMAYEDKDEVEGVAEPWDARGQDSDSKRGPLEFGRTLEPGSQLEKNVADIRPCVHLVSEVCSHCC